VLVIIGDTGLGKIVQKVSACYLRFLCRFNCALWLLFLIHFYIMRKSKISLVWLLD